MPNSKLTDGDVIEMRRLYTEAHWGYKKLRDRFGVSCGHCKRIVKGTRWRHVSVSGASRAATAQPAP